MKKIGIITLTGDKNYGNKLQNYALHYLLSKYNYDLFTIWPKINTFKKILIYFKRKLIAIFPFINRQKNELYSREKIFKEFDNNYLRRFYVNNKKLEKLNGIFDYFVIGSDQIWNPNVMNFYFGFSIFETNVKLFSYAASLGVSEVDDGYTSKVKYLFTKDRIPYISVREYTGAKIISEITNRNDINVNIDPTLLLSANEWDKLSKKPKQLKTDKYILTYFLGKLSDKRKQEIERVAIENNCEIINLLDVNSPFYKTGPSEFLYLEKNAFLICTDSFHSSVFALIYNTPFLIFDKEDNAENMSSRLNDFIEKFNLFDRKYNGKITDDLLIANYEQAYAILANERKKSDLFFEKALDIENNKRG